MGLDMYLTRRTYVQNWEQTPKEKRMSFSIKQGGKAFKGIDTKKIKYIEECVGYWRKANAIHNWFVQNCANGDSDQTEMYVLRSQLNELLEIVNKVLDGSKLIKGKIKNGQRSTANGWEDIMEDGEFIKNPELAKKLLPTVDGFFFGSTEYDQWYITDLNQTKKILEEILKRPDDTGRADYKYEASW